MFAAADAPHAGRGDGDPAGPVRGLAMSAERGHRVTAEWMGESIVTLSDLPDVEG